MDLENEEPITLKSLRERLNLTQQELSQRLNMSLRIIGFWENGEKLPRIDSAIALARELKVSLKDIARALGLEVDDLSPDIGSIEQRSPLRILREAAGLTPLELSKRLGISERRIYEWEDGEGLPRLDQAPTLARELGVSLKTICEAIGIGVEGVPDD